MKPNLAARTAEWSAAHRESATFGWIALVAIAAMLGMAAGSNKLTQDQSAPSSHRVRRALSSGATR